MKFSKGISIVLIATLLMGCAVGQSTDSISDATGATILGAVGGGVIGSALGGRSSTGQLLTIGLGAVIGGVVGNAIGRTYDEPNTHDQ